MAEVAPGYCECGRPSENIRNKEDNRCSTCKKNERRILEMERAAQEKRDRVKIDIRLKKNGMSKPINKISGKMADLLRVYEVKRKKFLKENPKCAVFPKKKATQVHHKAGKVGYHDDWARENNVPRWVDERFFLAVSAEGHEWIEKHPNEAKEKGWSLNRL